MKTLLDEIFYSIKKVLNNFCRMGLVYQDCSPHGYCIRSTNFHSLKHTADIPLITRASDHKAILSSSSSSSLSSSPDQITRLLHLKSEWLLAPGLSDPGHRGEVNPARELLQLAVALPRVVVNLNALDVQYSKIDSLIIMRIQRIC